MTQPPIQPQGNDAPSSVTRESTPPPVVAVLSAELRDVLDFTEKENQKHRDYFAMLYKWTAGALTILVVTIGGLVAFVGWHTVDDIKKQAAAATNDEINNIRSQSQQTLTQQSRQIQQQIAARLNEEFATPAIKQTIQDAARQQTAGALLPIITEQVHSQVGTGVKAEQRNIQQSLIQEVHSSVDELKPTINTRVDDTVSQAVDSSVRAQVDTQIAPRLKQLEGNAELSSLLIQAESGDGRAFDTIVGLASNSQAPQGTRDMALKVVRSLIAREYNNLVLRMFQDPKTETQSEELLGDQNPFNREAAINSLAGPYWTHNLDRLFRIMTTDSNLDVRAAAFKMFQGITKIVADPLDNSAASAWWAEHRKNFVK